MVDWSKFEKLPDSAQHNFEILCRSPIRLHYGQYGRFAALAAQPGVEFHLQLRENCALGKASDWFGWQCRWYRSSADRALGNARRTKIVDALNKTAKFLPDITDWVLWTRDSLTKRDQDWFYALNSRP